MSKGLSRQQVGILLYMRQREEGCVRRYLDAPQTATCYECGRPCAEDGPYGVCYRCHLRWCKKCTTTSQDIVVHFWPDPPQPKAKTLYQKSEEDPEFRAWVEAGRRVAALMPRLGGRRRGYVNAVHHTSVQRAMLGLEKKGLVSRIQRSGDGYQWATRWHRGFGWFWRDRPLKAGARWGQRLSVVTSARQHLLPELQPVKEGTGHLPRLALDLGAREFKP